MSIVKQDPVNLSLRAAIDLRWRRHELLAHNVANADTPGFRPKDLEFEGVLQSVVTGVGGATLAPVDGTGIEADGIALAAASDARPSETQDVVERPEVGDTLDDNAVDMDKEMARLADNSLTYQAELELLRRRYAAIQRAIAWMREG